MMDSLVEFVYRQRRNSTNAQKQATFKTVTGPYNSNKRAEQKNPNKMFTASSTDLDIGRLKLNEKETLNGINNRFATYIDKVRSLEAKNQQLVLKLDEYKSEKNIELTPEQIQYLQKLRAQVNDASLERSRAEIQRDNLVGEASELRWKLDHEHHLRSELDDELSRLRKDIDDATMVRIDLERKIETLREELLYAKKMHEEEIEDIKSQIEGQGIGVEADGLVPDIAELLREIRAQYELIVEKNRDETETWYKTKFEDLEMKSKQNADDLDKVQGDINDYRKQVTQLEMELESLKGSNDYLERNLSDTEKRYETESARHQAHVTRLAGELERANDDMKRHLAEYKLLMSQKLSLEKEIRTYARLLEGESERSSSESTIRTEQVTTVNTSSARKQSYSSDEEDESHRTKKTKKIIVKTIETRDGKIVSSSVSEKEMIEEGSASSSASSDSSEDEDDKNLD